ncbi:tetratricopeptide repeat protein 1-like protein [Euroglyphus maynei]|uniref:Tetratricopeptide repeat protein 1-like protein n=1 Tax=Euroglyphus maynei TaxID=6958 RepID=A0A1Y3BMU6_EURMA|nr:tetratricopeptide repeat protein 1-like protein [Euroglyphus maynei]
MADQEELTNESSSKEIFNDDSERKQKIVDLRMEGNQQFKLGYYEEAIQFYLNGLDLCTKPDDDQQTMVILYSNLAAAKDHLQRYDEAIEYCDKALAINDSHSKAIIRRAQLYRKCDKLDESMADYKRFVELNPDDKSVLPIVQELQCQIDERNEKLKAEMLTKLKDLGNVVLKPFGLSTDNFKLEKNPETGGYSVNFQQNK